MKNNSGIICQVTDGQYKGCYAVAYHKKQMPTITEAGKVVVTIYQDINCLELVTENVIIKVDKLIQAGFCD